MELVATRNVSRRQAERQDNRRVHLLLCHNSHSSLATDREREREREREIPFLTLHVRLAAPPLIEPLARGFLCFDSAEGDRWSGSSPGSPPEGRATAGRRARRKRGERSRRLPWRRETNPRLRPVKKTVTKERNSNRLSTRSSLPTMIDRSDAHSQILHY